MDQFREREPHQQQRDRQDVQRQHSFIGKAVMGEGEEAGDEGQHRHDQTRIVVEGRDVAQHRVHDAPAQKPQQHAERDPRDGDDDAVRQRRPAEAQQPLEEHHMDLEEQQHDEEAEMPDPARDILERHPPLEHRGGDEAAEHGAKAVPGKVIVAVARQRRVAVQQKQAERAPDHADDEDEGGALKRGTACEIKKGHQLVSFCPASATGGASNGPALPFSCILRPA
ncbi:hypothetical protein SDC9_34756 [bioreactor metagenome]|uniref:Uncharacterized protein n=1 Tax=bioreactor metagenome TaxID=1076179 RepID=A0A644VBL0_9ZZZZ